MLVMYEKRKMLARQAKKFRSKPPKQLYPASVEREYLANLIAYINFIQSQVKQILLPALPGLVHGAREMHPVTDSIHNDDYADNFNSLMAMLSMQIDKKNPVSWKALAMNIGQKTFKWNNAQWQKTMKKVMGVNTIDYAPWVQSSLNSFAIDNVTLIKSIKSKSLTSIQTMASNALRMGTRHEVIAKNIEDQFRTTKKQAKLIARDQVSKLNGQLAMMRQKDIGISEYIWRTSGDDRVRNSHAIMEGKKCRWDNDKVYWNGKTWASRKAIGGVEKHPGQDYQCRCWPEPVFDPIYDAIDKGVYK